MPIATTDLVQYGALLRPQDDTAAAGGARDEQHRATFLQLLANSTIAAVSSAADTRSLTLNGRDATGAAVQEVIVLTGTTQVSGAQIFERLHTAVLSVSGAQTVTVKGSGTTLGTIPANERGFTSFFINSASDPSVIKIRYEKLHFMNKHATLSLTSATVQLLADPDARIRTGVAAANNDSLQVTNRLTAPGGITFVDDGVSQAVPGNALAAGASVGLWAEENLPAGDSPHRTSFTPQLAGNST